MFFNLNILSIVQICLLFLVIDILSFFWLNLNIWCRDASRLSWSPLLFTTYILFFINSFRRFNLLTFIHFKNTRWFTYLSHDYIRWIALLLDYLWLQRESIFRIILYIKYLLIDSHWNACKTVRFHQIRINKPSWRIFFRLTESSCLHWIEAKLKTIIWGIPIMLAQVPHCLDRVSLFLAFIKLDLYWLDQFQIVKVV